MKLKKQIIIGILLFWMIIIFGFSNQNIRNSLSLSDKVSNHIIDTGIKITKKEVSLKEREVLVKKLRVIIRKTAHFTEYFILGLLVYCLFEIYSVPKKTIYALIFCFLYACSDELHQLFSDGRSARFLDVCIDTSGSTLSIVTFLIIKAKLKKSKTRMNELEEFNQIG